MQQSVLFGFRQRMFGVSFFEFVLILVVALVVFGPEKLPEIARMIGKVTGDFQKTSNALRREFYNAVYEPAKEDLNRAKSEIAQLRSDISSVTRLEPSCPDTIAKRSALVQNSASTLLPEAAPSSAVTSNSIVAPRGEAMSSALHPEQKDTVAVTLPFQPQPREGDSK
jgi:sec-independent protein translocase protein TatA